MASIPVLKLGAAALIALGAADVAWIDLELGPRVVEPDRAAVAQFEPAKPTVAMATPPVAAAPPAPEPAAPPATKPAPEPAPAQPEPTPAPAQPAPEPAPEPAAKPAAKPAPAPAPAQPAPEPAAQPATEPGSAAIATIYFESSSRRVGSSARQKLAEAAARAGAHGIIHLEGHADIRGEDAYNEELSKRRVDNSAAALIKDGFDPERIVRSAVGKRGAGQTADAELWRDRRVDVWIEGGTE